MDDCKCSKGDVRIVDDALSGLPTVTWLRLKEQIHQRMRNN
jgi:hypothetical protein